MKIAILSYHTCPLATLGGKDTGGMNVYVRDLCINLGKIGVHADVFTRSQNARLPHILYDLGHGNRVVHIKAGPESPQPKNELVHYLDEFITNIDNFSKMKNIQYDVIHSHYWLSGLAAIELKKEWDAPIIHMYHTLAKLKNKVAMFPDEIEGDVRITGETKVGKLADKIVAATAIEVEQMVNLYNFSQKKIHVIPPGVDINRFYPLPQDEAKEFVGVPANEKMILFVGRIEPLKGIDNLINALASMRKSDVLSECPHYLIIIGGNTDKENGELNTELLRLQKLCDELGLQDLVLFLGKRAQDTLPYYYSAAEMVVMPSHYESFGMVALEAMACGTPVIATQVGGLAHLVKDGYTGLIVPDGDLQALEQSITLLICKPEYREELSQNCVNYAKSYSWDKIIKEIISLYKN